MLAFSIHDVKSVEELHNPGQVNCALEKGWRLLSVGFESDGEESEKIYILGHTDSGVKAIG